MPMEPQWGPHSPSVGPPLTTGLGGAAGIFWMAQLQVEAVGTVPGPWAVAGVAACSRQEAQIGSSAPGGPLTVPPPQTLPRV